MVCRGALDDGIHDVEVQRHAVLVEDAVAVGVPPSGLRQQRPGAGEVGGRRLESARRNPAPELRLCGVRDRRAFAEAGARNDRPVECERQRFAHPRVAEDRMGPGGVGRARVLKRRYTRSLDGALIIRAAGVIANLRQRRRGRRDRECRFRR